MIRPYFTPFHEQARRTIEERGAAPIPGRCRRFAFGQVEQHVAPLVLTEPEGQLGTVLVDELDALGQRVDGDLDGVVAGPG